MTYNENCILPEFYKTSNNIEQIGQNVSIKWILYFQTAIGIKRQKEYAVYELLKQPVSKV